MAQHMQLQSVNIVAASIVRLVASSNPPQLRWGTGGARPFGSVGSFGVAADVPTPGAGLSCNEQSEGLGQEQQTQQRDVPATGVPAGRDTNLGLGVAPQLWIPIDINLPCASLCWWEDLQGKHVMSFYCSCDVSLTEQCTLRSIVDRHG